MTKKRVLHVIKTVSIENDGRLQKWIRFLNQKRIESEVFILEDNNEHGVDNKYDAKIIRTTLSSRQVFKKRTGYVFKVPEYFFRFQKFIRKQKNNYDVIVFHDLQQYLNIAPFVFFKKGGPKIAWDLHEVPHPIMYKFKLAKSYIKHILESLDLVVYTNEERRAFIKEKFNHREEKFFILNNYPEHEYNEQAFQSLPQTVKIWLDDADYILWLGVTNRARNFHTFLKVYISRYQTRYKLVIIGKIDEEFKEEIDGLKEKGRVYSDFVKQGDIVKYIDSALFSVVLYNAASPNNYYCEPNRLYQLINRNIPVIVGNNPTMKNIVQSNNFGVILEDDGSDEELMVNAINEITTNHNVYKKNLNQSLSKRRFNIDSQLSDLATLLSKFS